MIEAINTFIGPVFMHIVIASGIAALFMMLSFVTIRLLRVHNLTLTYNAYFITLLSFLAVPVIALILTEVPIDKPHFDFMPISPPVETIESTSTITYESSEIEMVPQDKFNRRETASNEETSGAVHEKFRLGSIMKLMRKHLPVIWFSGLLLFSSLLILNLVRLKTIRNRSKFLKNIDPREFGFSLTKVSLLTSNQINSPAVISIRKPEIILPEGLLENSTDEETKFILCHELTHILRKDFLVNLIQNIFLSFNFFNPIFWILNKRLNILRENICDNWVLSRHSDRKAYANLLLKFIEKFQQKSGIMEPSIGIFRSHSQIGSRIHRILTSSHLSTLTTPGARRIGLVLSLSLFLLAGWIYAGMQKPNGKLQQEIQKIKDKGEPTTIKELIPEEIPDKENGALVYQELPKIISHLYTFHQSEWDYLFYEPSLPWSETPEGTKKKIINLLFDNSEFTNLYQLLEKISKMKCWFSPQETLSGTKTRTLLESLRQSVRLLNMKAEIEAENGNINEALRTSLVSLKTCNSFIISQSEPLIAAIRCNVYAIVSNIEGILKKKEGNPILYQDLIQEIEKVRKYKLAHSSLIKNRAIGIYNFNQLRENPEKFLLSGDFAKMTAGNQLKKIIEKDPKSFINKNELFYLEWAAKQISFAGKPYWQIRKKLEKCNRKMGKEIIESEGNLILAGLLLSKSVALYNEEARLDAELGNAKIALACHIYKQKHGNYPSSLAKLTPRIIRRLPKDPFTGRNYIYRRGKAGFIVYSLGDNAKDDGGISGSEKKWQGDFDIVWMKVKEIATADKFFGEYGIKDKATLDAEKAKQDAYLCRCRSNMKQILLAIKMYAQDYGEYPDKLSDLYPDYVSNLEVFTCPATKGKITNKEEIDTKSSYEYRGKGLTEEIIEKDPQRIILIEKNANHTIDGKLVRCIGYADGHVATEIQKVPQSKPQFRIKLTHIRTEKGKEIIINAPEIIALLDTPASIDIGDKDSTPYFHYEVTPSLTKEGMVLLKINYELREVKGKTTSVKTQVILKDGESKELSSPPGSKRKTIIFVEKIKTKDKPDSGGGKSYKSKKEKLTLDDLKNADYVCLYYGKGVRLKNGIYEERYADSASKLHVGIYKDKVAFGDLNNDGRDDAVVVIESYSGGSGHFYELAVVINNNGKPLCFIPKRLGDRVIVNSVLINKAGKIIVDMIAHRSKDGLAKPTLRKIIEYKLYGYILIQLRENGMADDINIEQYLHKKAIFWQAFPSVGTHGLSSQKAMLFAVRHLEKRGIKNIKICETRWIAAPFGAYFIDGKGDFSIEEKNYSTFRIGVRDGTEEKNGKLKAGEELLFIARGVDNKGKVIWYPEPGPDFQPAEMELSVYKFLYGDDRARFENLSIRFKSAKTEDETADIFSLERPTSESE